MSYSENTSYFDFIKRRVIKILPAYYVAILLWCFWVHLGIAPKPIDTSVILSHLFLVHNLFNSHFYAISGVFWFLGVLFNFYLIFPLLCKIQNRTKYGLEIITFVVFALALFLAVFFDVKSHVFTKSIFINLPCFTFGMLLAKGSIVKLFKKDFLRRILLIVVIFILLFVKTKGFMGTNINLVAIITSMILGLLCILYKQELEKIPNFLKNFLSEIAIASYSIYLFNYIFYCAKPVCKNSAIIFIYIFFVFGFGYCMYRLIEEPINKFIKQFRF